MVNNQKILFMPILYEMGACWGDTYAKKMKLRVKGYFSSNQMKM